MDSHEAADIFPLDEEGIAELAKDIQINGQRMPVELLDGKIIDGRRRWRACESIGIRAVTKVIATDDPVAYSWSLNGVRRNLTTAQKSMAGARMREIYERKARERMSQGGGDKKSKAAKSGVENLPPPISDSGKTRDVVGKIVGVSGKMIDHATKVLNHAIPEVVKEVEEGRMAVNIAAGIATEPAEKQRAAAAKSKSTPQQRKEKQKPKPEEPPEPEAEPAEIKSLGVGVRLGHEAVNCLSRIPKNDALRKRGFQIVMDWIKANNK